MRQKRIMAVILAAAMVLGGSLTAGATEPENSNNASLKESVSEDAFLSEEYGSEEGTQETGEVTVDLDDPSDFLTEGTADVSEEDGLESGNTSETSDALEADSVAEGEEISDEDADGEEDTDDPDEDAGIMTLSYKAYTYADNHSGKAYDYGSLNFSKSSDGYSASDILSKAVEYIIANEGNYTTVLKSDVGKGLSIGKIGWHADNALLLLQLIISEDSEAAYDILGEELYNEITADGANWSDSRSEGYRILTDDEAEKVEKLLGTDKGIYVQDKLAESYVISYLNNGYSLGLRKGAVLVDYADMENQYGYYQTTENGVPVRGSHQCVEYAINLAGSASAVTLNDIHIAGVIYVAVNAEYSSRGSSMQGAYIERRRLVYQKLVESGWAYGDYVMPYDTDGTVGAAWLKNALNIYMNAGLTVNSNYDSALKTAVKTYQKAVGLTEDGCAGLVTSTHLIYDMYYNAVTTGGAISKFTDIVKTNGKWIYTVGGEPDYTYTGLAKNSNGWWYVEKGVVNFDYTGFAENSNGKWYCEDSKVTFNANSVYKDTTGAIGTKGTWYYVVGSKVQTSFTGLANYKNSNGWWYIKNGVVDFTAHGVYKNNNGWYYVDGGKVQFSYDGFGKNSNGSWYIEGGKVRFDKSSVIKDTTGELGTKGTWYYVVDSKVQYDFTGLAHYKNANGWWYIKNGVVDFNAEGVYKNQNGWWYVNGGKVQFSYNGFASNSNGKWYLENGKVTFNKNSVIKDTTGAIGTKGTWYYVVGSKVQTSFTGLANYKNSNGWWYIENGVVDFTAEGVYKNNNGWWYVSGGKVRFSYDGFAENSNGKWYIEGGKVRFNKNSVIKDTTGAIGTKGTWYYVVGSKVQTSFTGLANYKNSNGWWYIRDGVVDFTFNGIAQNNNGWWYIKNGKVDFSFTGTVTVNGTKYSVTKGKVDR